MSYFDHVRCTACKAHLDPESLAVVPGQGMSCPQCNAPLSAGDLFGLKDAFVGIDDEGGNDLSLDDLFASGGSSGGSSSGGSARGRGASSPLESGPATPAPRAGASPRRSAWRKASGRSSETGLARHSAPDDDDASEGSSALDAMRALKKR